MSAWDAIKAVMDIAVHVVREAAVNKDDINLFTSTTYTWGDWRFGV